MQGFLVQSIIASVILTVLLNLLPRLFPQATDRAEQRIHEQVRQTFEERNNSAPENHEAGGRGEPQKRGGMQVKVFFPWKAMLAISLGLTVLVNAVGYLAN